MNPVVDHLNKSVWARVAPSQIDGIGVIAIRDIPAGTVIADHKFYKAYMSSSELDELDEAVRNLILDQTLFTDEEIMFDHPNTNVRLRAFMNHAAKANTDGLKALKDIKKGEELTENYNDCVKGLPLIDKQLNYFKFLK